VAQVSYALTGCCKDGDERSGFIKGKDFFNTLSWKILLNGLNYENVTGKT
jgi:hypothetical protein